MKEKCLKPTYLQKWLNNTCQDLSKLEQEAAPAGWLLQWDRYGHCVHRKLSILSVSLYYPHESI